MFDAAFNEAVSGYSTGEKGKGRDIIAALRALKEIEGREPTDNERAILRRFPGFGCVALSIFPDPRTGQFREGWEQIGRELRELLTGEEYASARRTTFNAFYTSPVVMRAAYAGLNRLGLPADALVLEPGCGAGGFMGAAPAGMRFIGVEMDSVSGRIARALYPGHDIRIENFRDSRLPTVDAVIGNVPFADIRYGYGPHRFSLHDYFFAKSVDALAPGGVLALVTSRFTLDKLDGSAREYLAAQADFLGAIRLPDEAFKDQGTTVVTDIVFLAKRHPAAAANHAGDWLNLATLPLDGETRVNAWFAERPDMVMGEFAIGRGRYGRNTLKVDAADDYEDRLFRAVRSLPAGVFSPAAAASQAACQPAPVPAGLGEGSFLIENGAILQIECGRVLPVMHGQTALRAGEGKMGRRLAALIELRDRAREVLRSQNEGWPEQERQDARRRMNRAYDAFVPLYGPINKTTFSVNAQGNEVRRMPNLVRFREDPDAFLVMSLEEYDEATGKAAKSPILLQDVVGPASPVTSVATAEEGLLVSLNERGRVDPDYIAALYGRDRDTVLAELGELVFRDPETGAWETRDAYLSGNVRRKLAAAREAGIESNIRALEAIQPEDILPGDIDANLGAPWIPADVIRAFAADLFGVGRHSIRIDHLPKDALWALAGDREAEESVANTAEFGTKRITGLALLEQALNLRTPKIHDEIRDANGGTKRVVNQEQTVAALEKQSRIKQRFSGWIFNDPDRAERLVRIYNDLFNNLVVRTFDGSHQTFPGMNRTVTLRPHQTAAIWRVVSSGNTLLAHAVGAGKTYEMAAAAMKLKQTGLVRKSVIAVPNHMLEQFGREFLHLYPNARLLIAGKEDLARDRRKLLTAKIATGNWDAIVVTHSSFERIGMSSAFQEEFIRGEISEYRSLLSEAKAGEDKGRNIIKTLEKRLASFEDKLKELIAGDKKDDGLVFDELGVDQLFVDEAHYFKNLATPTKMDRVAGIQTEGSERAFDLLMKARYLERRTPGRGLVFATGTPISNTMVEMYTLKRYLAPALLEERGIAHFDAWAASFGEVVHTMEISPDGSSLRSNARFAKFVNLPELQQMFRSFADVQTADMLKLPVPALKGGKATVVSCPMSDEQREIQAGLVARYERIRRGGVSPKDDNALAITTDGRKLALDVRLINPDAVGSQDSKLTAVFNKAAGIWRTTADVRATQMIFCDIGVNPTGWGFSVYEEIKRGLMDHGVPREEIADIGDANTDAKKAALFERMRAGQVRFMLGSTAKMGTGTNVQTRLYAMHHVDAPWKPAEIEQRDGRILRQGNRNKEVEIYRYVTEGSFDAYMWQTLQSKARFIAQVMKGDAGVRRASDIGGQELSFAEVKAIASGNPAILTLAGIEADVQRLTLLKRSHADEQYRARQQVKYLPEDIERLTRKAEACDADHALAAAAGGEITVGGRVYRERDKAIEAMNVLLKQHLANVVSTTHRREIGVYRGFRLTLEADTEHKPELIFIGKRSYRREFGSVAAGSLFNYIDSVVESLPREARKARDEARLKAGQLEDFRARMGQRFEQEDQLDWLERIRSRLEALLSGTEGEPGEIGRLVAGYEENRDGLVTALRASTEPEPSPVEIAPIPVEPVAAAPPAAGPPIPGVLTEAWAGGCLFAAVEIPTKTNQTAARRAEAPKRGNRAQAWTQDSLFGPVETPVKAKPAARRRTVERAVQLRLL